MKKQMPAAVPMSTRTPPEVKVGPAAIGGTAGPLTQNNPATQMPSEPMSRTVNDARRGTHNVDNLLPESAMHSDRGMKGY
jgi:hypothetical protein